MALDKRYQAMAKSGSGVLVGVSQIRVGLPSVRAAGLVTGTATVKAVQQVPDSTVKTVTGTDGTTAVKIVEPGVVITPKVNTLVAGGTYTGMYDGCFIVRYTSATECEIYSPDGTVEALDATDVTDFATTPYVMKVAATPGAVPSASGATISGVVTTPVAGTTFIIPVWSSSAISRVQTGIISPYSPFLSDSNSVGGLKDVSWDPKLDDVKKMTSGFPEIEVDSMIVKTSVGIKFTAQEWENPNMAYLVDMINSTINKSELASVPIEVVMRTRGGQLRTFWHPTCALESLPSVAPKNDYSDFSWSFSAQKSTEVDGESVQYNSWLSNANVYNYLKYIH